MKTFLALCLALCGSVCVGNEWVPYVYRPPVVVQQAPIVQMVPYYYSVPVPVMVPLAPQYVPVTSYQNVLVERRYNCFFKRYEVVSIPQTIYIPIK